MVNIARAAESNGRIGPISKRKGFSLIELLIVMLILGATAGGLSFIFSDADDGDKLVREEADNFALWLTDSMARAETEECGFKLSMSQQSIKNASFRITWQGGSQHGATKTYQSSRVRIFPVTGDLSKARVFNGEWSSMTPALTLDVKPQPSCKGKALYVVVSGAGYVTIRDKIN